MGGSSRYRWNMGSHTARRSQEKRSGASSPYAELLDLGMHVPASEENTPITDIKHQQHRLAGRGRKSREKSAVRATARAIAAEGWVASTGWKPAPLRKPRSGGGGMEQYRRRKDGLLMTRRRRGRDPQGTRRGGRSPRGAR